MFRSPVDASPRAALRLTALLLLALTGFAEVALARSDDRSQPMTVNSDHADATLTDAGTTTLTGNVQLTQGSLEVNARRGVLQTRNGEIVHVLFEGEPARLNQLDDNGQPMSAQARRIEYDMSGDEVVLSGAAEVVQARGTLRGERIRYNLSTGNVDAGGQGGRVQMVIQPKTASPAPDAKPERSGD
jgi:lipopolysaccharide export system protein LptA